MLSNPNTSQSQLVSLPFSIPHDDDGDFQIPLSQNPRTIAFTSQKPNPSSQRSLLKPSNSSTRRPSKKPKCFVDPGKENIPPADAESLKQRIDENDGEGLKLDESCSLELIGSSIDCSYAVRDGNLEESVVAGNSDCLSESEKKKGMKMNEGYLHNSIESRLTRARVHCGVDAGNDGSDEELGGDFEENTELDVLLRLCTEGEETDGGHSADFIRQEGSFGNNLDGDCCDSLVQCPLCGADISDLSDELRQIHTNDCLDKEENEDEDVALPGDDGEILILPPVVDGPIQSPRQVIDVSPVLRWLHNLGLSKYREVFVREEIDWDALQWLTEEDLFSMGVTALGPRKKIVHALTELRKEYTPAVETRAGARMSSELRSKSTHQIELNTDASKVIVDETSKASANKLITDYFPGSNTDRTKICHTSRGHCEPEKCQSQSGRKRGAVKRHVKHRKLKDVPSWCSILGTPFRVDAFKYLRGACSHWFLTHFHMDHYQGLTRSFCHGKIYCSSITAKLVNMKIGIPWEKLQVLPLNQKVNIAGIDVTCLDANHCPGSIIILFEPPNGKAVLHTGDFRFCEEMASISVLQRSSIHTLILDTTYCDSQYDFPKQDAVIQFVIEAIQAEAFNPKTLFLIGSYTIGKERLFLEVARILRRKVYVGAAKLRILECLEFSEEDTQWFTLDERESNIHVVPMWTLASFKRLKHITNQFKCFKIKKKKSLIFASSNVMDDLNTQGRFSLFVVFSPTGWTFGKGKKRSPGRRLQQGTIIRYDVPYSEHSSFTELKEFVKLVSPENIIPSVNNDGPTSANNMVSLLLS